MYYGDDNAAIDPITGTSNGTSSTTPKSRGPKKDRAMKKKLERDNIQSAYYQVCSMYASEMEACKKRVAPGTLARIISDVESEKEIPRGTLKRSTIVWRLQKKNLSGLNRNNESPLRTLKPVIVDWCISLAKIGYAQTRNELIALVQNL